MKKIFKALLAVMVAVVMSFAMVAFAACDPTGNNNDKNNGTLTNDTIDKITETDFKALNLNADIGVSGIGNFDMDAKVNLDGNADIKLVAVGSGENAGENYYQYVFMRDWKVYAVVSEEEVTDFTEAEFRGLVDLKKAMDSFSSSIPEELPFDISGLFDIDNLAKDALGQVNGELLSLANAAGAVSSNSGTITVDINKLVYNFVTDVKAVLKSLKGTTTIGDILNNQTVRKYAMTMTESVTPQELVSLIKDYFEMMGSIDGAPDEVTALISQLDELFTKVTPDKNSTTYEYIVKILSSQELVDLFNSAMGMPEGMGINQKITEFTLNGIYSMASGETEADIEPMLQQLTSSIEEVTAGITATEFNVSSAGVCIKGAKMVYNYGTDGLTSQKLEANVTAGGMVMTIDATLTYVKTAYTSSDLATLPDELPEIDGFPPEINDGYFNVAGERFVCVDVEYDYDDFGLSPETVQNLEETIQRSYVDFYRGSYLEFNYDGTYVGNAGFSAGVYEQYEDLVFIADNVQDLDSGNCDTAFLYGQELELSFSTKFSTVVTIYVIYEVA